MFWKHSSRHPTLEETFSNILTFSKRFTETQKVRGPGALGPTCAGFDRDVAPLGPHGDLCHRTACAARPACLRSPLKTATGTPSSLRDCGRSHLLPLPRCEQPPARSHSRAWPRSRPGAAPDTGGLSLAAAVRTQGSASSFSPPRPGRDGEVPLPEASAHVSQGGPLLSSPRQCPPSAMPLSPSRQEATSAGTEGAEGGPHGGPPHREFVPCGSPPSAPSSWDLPAP